MRNDQRTAYETRDEILKLLSADELGFVSSAEEGKIPEGGEYLDLEHLELGVQVADPDTHAAHMLPRTAVADATWDKILEVLETPIEPS
jgi:hypothetical protein